MGREGIENPDAKAYIDHIDGDRLNNSVSILRWVTNQENSSTRAERNPVQATIKASVIIKPQRVPDMANG